MTDEKTVLTPEERRQRNHDETAAHILQAAREVMREQGVADLNLQAIARRVGMRAPSLYNYYNGKVAIYEALFVLGMRMYRERLERMLAEYGANRAGIEQLLTGYLEFALENPELFQLCFERPVPGFTPSEEGLAESARLLDIAHRITTEAIAAGALPDTYPVATTMNLLIAIMHGYTAQHLANEPHLPAGEGRFGSLIPTIMDLLNALSGSQPGGPTP